MHSRYKLIFGDALESIKDIESNSVDLIITSPPYANRRRNSYDSIPEDKYLEWFVPIGKEIKRIMSPSGSFFLNLKTHAKNGERSLYVMKLIIALRENVGFRFVDEFAWTKNAFPGSYRGRFKNGWEPVYHFTKSKPSEITFNPTACGTPTKPESIARAYRKQSGKPKNGSGMTGMNTTNVRNLKVSRPSNVIHVTNMSNQFTLKQHYPATFPLGLCDFFIKSFSNKGDIILDPFAGSGTSIVSAIQNGRVGWGIDNKKEYIDLAEARIKQEC